VTISLSMDASPLIAKLRFVRLCPLHDSVEISPTHRSLKYLPRSDGYQDFKFCLDRMEMRRVVVCKDLDFYPVERGDCPHLARFV
jgi:hypothetical protein